MNSLPSFESILDHGAVDPSVQADVISLQLRTAASVHRRLDRLGGAILGDEVGSGKTFVTFAVIAKTLVNDPKRGMVILVPNELLEAKWERQLQEYLRTAIRAPGVGSRWADRVVRLDRSMRVVGSGGAFPKSNALVIGRNSLFSYRVARSDQVVAIEAYLTRRDDLTHKPWKKFLAACGGLTREDFDPSRPGWADRAMLTASPQLTEPIREPFDLWINGQKDVKEAFSHAIQEVRRRVGRKILPRSSLIVVDEAHNLRNTESQIYKSLMGTLRGKFDALLFLTGTPFQLGRGELRNIVEFFRHASHRESTPEEFNEALQLMISSMDNYVDAIDSFGRAWSDLDATGTALTMDILNLVVVPGPEDSRTAANAAAHFKNCLFAKEKLEDGLRPFLIRSVRERHHHELPGLFNNAVPSPESRIPLALVDRLLYEIFREQGRTFVASVSQGACSSWEALLDSAAMRDSRKEGQTSRKLLKALAQRRALGPHPKVESTIDFCQQGVSRGEKTLVFVERTTTGQSIKSALAAQLAEQDPDDDAKDVLQRRSRLGWPSLRENYLHTIFPLAFGATPDPGRIPELAQRYQDVFTRSDSGRGTDRDYAVEKRFWEHVFVLDALNSRRTVADIGYLREAVDLLSSSAYVLNGLERPSGETGKPLNAPKGKRGTEARRPRLDFGEAYVCYASPWGPHAEELAVVPLSWRATFVDAVASSIGRSHLRHEVADITTDRDVSTTFKQLEALLSDVNRGWPARFVRLVEQLADAAKNPDESETKNRVERLVGGFRSNERVQFVGADSKVDTRSRAIAGFNTPLYPDILIATPILGEGIDLHRSCRRIVHHDLPWNPAELEQRTGRIDRVGSLVDRMREADSPEACIEISLPFMSGTYDEYIFERVTARRREFRCLLGSPPEWAKDEPSDGEPRQPIDGDLVRRLQVDLGPGHGVTVQ